MWVELRAHVLKWCESLAITWLLLPKELLRQIQVSVFLQIFLTWMSFLLLFCCLSIKPAPHAAAYKPNAAFFEALGPNLGAACLRKVIKSIPDDIPVLLDVKRGDIGSTAQAYAEACYEREEGLSADGVTLSPLMGWDSVQPFVTGVYLHVE